MNRGETLVCAISMKYNSHSYTFRAFPNNARRVDILYISEFPVTIFRICWTEPAFRANLFFGYVQSGNDPTSFSGSTVPGVPPTALTMMSEGAYASYYCFLQGFASIGHSLAGFPLKSRSTDFGCSLPSAQQVMTVYNHHYHNHHHYHHQYL